MKLTILPFLFSCLFISIIPQAQEEQSEALLENSMEMLAMTDDQRLTSGLPDHFLFSTTDRVFINKVTHDQLVSWGILSALQIHAFLWYRETIGDFISLMELQAVPNWDAATIQKVLPYFNPAIQENRTPRLRQRFKEGSHQLRYRTGGKLSESNTSKSGHLPHLLTYRFRFRTMMQWGITLETDAGELKIPDYRSAYLKLTDIGIIRQLIAGDFTVNMGQGLIHWQGFSAAGTGMLNSFKQGDVFRPHTGRDENMYHRGIAVHVAKNKWHGALFISRHPIDANLDRDSVSGRASITSFLISGLHQTDSEIANKGAVNQTGLGGKIGYNTGKFKVSCNVAQFQFDQSILKRNLPYNLFEQQGKSFFNLSVDGVLISPKGLIYGEWAVDKQLKSACNLGWIRSLHNKLDFALHYRNMSAPYQSWQSGCFSTNGQAGNEKGFYLNLNCSLSPSQRIAADFDVYKHPWVKAQADALSHGQTASVQYTWKASKKAEWTIRLQQNSRWLNATGGNQIEGQLVKNDMTRIRVHLSFTPGQALTIRLRHEISFLKSGSLATESGSLSYTEFIYKPLMKPFSISIRYALYDTESYGSRIYAYERDVPAYQTIPAFFGHGKRIYAVGNLKWRKNMVISAKWIAVISTPEVKQEWRLQLSWQVNKDN